MATNDLNPIRPVENLPNVAGLTPTGQQQERKRRQNPRRQEQAAQAASPDRTEDEPKREHDGDAHVIDYQA
jgi:hypothetical protein